MIEIVMRRHLFLHLQNRIDIPINIQDISMVGFGKKRRAKKAICRLLSITPHSTDEIADHFEMSPELVKALLLELTKANLVVTVPGVSPKYCLKEKILTVRKRNNN